MAAWQLNSTHAIIGSYGDRTKWYWTK